MFCTHSYILLTLLIGIVACKMQEINQTDNNPRHLQISIVKEKFDKIKHILLSIIKDKNKPGPTTINSLSTSTEVVTDPTTIQPSNTEPRPCYKDNRLAILVDASGSVGAENYKIALEFAASLLGIWKKYGKNDIAAAVYGSSVLPIITFDEGAQLDEDGVIMAMLSAPYIATSTASDLALNWALNEHSSSSSSVDKNLVFLTDGFSDDPRLTAAVAERLKDQGIKVYAVGIGSNTNQQELLLIAANQSAHVFNALTFDDLLELLRPVSEAICM